MIIFFKGNHFIILFYYKYMFTKEALGCTKIELLKTKITCTQFTI